MIHADRRTKLAACQARWSKMSREEIDAELAEKDAEREAREESLRHPALSLWTDRGERSFRRTWSANLGFAIAAAALAGVAMLFSYFLDAQPGSWGDQLPLWAFGVGWLHVTIALPIQAYLETRRALGDLDDAAADGGMRDQFLAVPGLPRPLYLHALRARLSIGREAYPKFAALVAATHAAFYFLFLGFGLVVMTPRALWMLASELSWWALVAFPFMLALGAMALVALFAAPLVLAVLPSLALASFASHMAIGSSGPLGRHARLALGQASFFPPNLTSADAADIDEAWGARAVEPRFAFWRQQLSEVWWVIRTLALLLLVGAPLLAAGAAVALVCAAAIFVPIGYASGWAASLLTDRSSDSWTLWVIVFFFLQSSAIAVGFYLASRRRAKRPFPPGRFPPGVKWRRDSTVGQAEEAAAP